jgi:two-component system OmpR family response regulator
MASLPKVLLVEDDKNVRDTLVLALASEYEVDIAITGKTAIYKTDYIDYDQIILDLNLPDMSGADVCVSLRNRGLRAPILILSGVSNISAKVSLLDLGASDYLTKPFALGELKARLRALARRSVNLPRVQTRLEAYGVTLDRSTLSVTRDGVLVPLRRKEFELLACLMEHAGQVVSRTSLVNQVWPSLDGVWTNTVDVHINHLRDKLDKPFGSQLIHTLHGQGYKLMEIKIKEAA